MNKRQDWRVTTYREDGTVAETWIIADRTEDEATREASADTIDAADWSMVPAK